MIINVHPREAISLSSELHCCGFIRTIVRNSVGMVGLHGIDKYLTLYFKGTGYCDRGDHGYRIWIIFSTNNRVS